MPLRIETVSGGRSYGWPFVGEVNQVDHVKLDVSGMTTAEVDADGYLKPGVPLKINGTLVGSGEIVHGVTIEAVKIATNNSGLASDTSDPLVAVCTHGLINRDIVEDNLGRALTADELAAFNAAGSHIKVTST